MKPSCFCFLGPRKLPRRELEDLEHEDADRSASAAMGCASSVAVPEGGEGHATAGARVPQNKGNVGKGAAVRDTTFHADSETLVVRALEKSKSVMLSKFPEYTAEQVLNDLQCLLQVQHHLALLSQKDCDLGDLIKIHEWILEALPQVTSASASSFMILLDATRLDLCLVQVFFVYSLNDKDFGVTDLATAKKKWMESINQTRQNLRRMTTSLRKVNAPLLVLNNNISLLETAIVALKDPKEKQKALIATGKAVFSLAKSILQCSMDKNLISDFATLGSMSVEKLKQTNASRIYISIHRQDVIKHHVINTLSTSVDPVAALFSTGQLVPEPYQDQLRSLQLELMANPSADLMSKFVEVIFEVLLGPKHIQLSITPSQNPSSGYSIIELDTVFVLWLINGEEEMVRSERVATADTPFLGLKGLSKLGLKTNQNPDASVRFKEWGKSMFSDFLRGDGFDPVQRASVFREILEEEFFQGLYDIRCQLQTKVQEHANHIFEGLFEQFFVSVCENLDDPVNQNIGDAKNILSQVRAGDFEVIDKRLQRLTELGDKGLTISKDKLKRMESGLVKGKDLLMQMRELMKKVLEMQAQGIRILTKALSFLKPAVEMLRKIVAIVTDLAKWKFPTVVNVGASIAMAKLSSLNTLSREFEEQAQAKLDKFNKAGAVLDAKSRDDILDLIEKEIRGEIAPSAQEPRAGDADSAAQQQSSTIENSQNLLRRLFRLLETTANEAVSEAESAVEGAVTEAVGKLLPDETMLVLNSTVDSMLAVQEVLEQKIFELERVKRGVEEARASLDSKILEPIGSILSAIREHVRKDDGNIKACIEGMPGPVLAAFRMCNTLCSHGESLLSACEKSGQMISMMQFKPVKLSGASDSKLNGVYLPTILQHGGKPEFRQVGARSGFALIYKDEQGWCVCEDSEGAPVLESNSHVEMPHMMVDEKICMTEGPAGDKVSIEEAQSSLSSLDMGGMTEKMKTRLRDAADGVLSAAQDLLADAYEECESAFNNAKEELEDALDLEEIQMELPDLLLQFKPLGNVMMEAGWAILQNNNKLAQRELFRVRAVSFFALAQLKACLISAREAQNKGIGQEPQLDLEAALKAVEALIVRMSSLETDRRLKAFFKTASFAGEVWKLHNTGWRNLAAEQSKRVDDIGILIEDIAREEDPRKKQRLVKELSSAQTQLQDDFKSDSSGKILCQMLIGLKQDMAKSTAAVSAVSREAWDDEKKQIESELRLNLADLKTKQERIEASDADVVAKQVLMMQVREEQLAIMTQLSNVQEVGSDLGVSVPFLQGLQGQLDTINNKLDELAAAVKETADNVRMLVGRPVMEVLETHRTDLIDRRKNNLPDSVYIPTECLEVRMSGTLSVKFFDDKGQEKYEIRSDEATPGYLHPKEEGLYVFAVHDEKSGDTIMVGARSATFKSADDKTGTMSGDLYRVAKGKIDLKNVAAVIEAYDKAADKKTNFTVSGVPVPRTRLMGKIKEFLASEPASKEDNSTDYGPLSKKGVMLIHGPAGAGKTRFSRELELQILDEYYNERKKQGVTVILIKCQLQILQQPLTDLFFETMRRQYHLRDVQIHALYDKILDEQEKIECVFLLDGYDEMRPEFHKHNLFSSNNLENFRNGGSKSTSFNYPKVIFLSRSELFAGRAFYDKVFLPLEAQNINKDEEHEARLFFHELRIASFDSRMNTYLSAYCALALRQNFERQCGNFRPTAPSYIQTLKGIVEKTLGSTTDDETKDAIHAMAKALTCDGELEVPNGQPAPEDAKAKGDDSLGPVDRAKTQMIRIVDMLDDFRVTCPGQGHAGKPKLNKTDTRDLVEAALDAHVWTQRMFVERIERITGLKELTRTPFLATIVADIMYVLHEMSSSPGEVKQQMLLLLGNEAESEMMVEQSWALLRKDRSSSTIGYKDPICTTVESLSRTQTLLKQKKIIDGDVVCEANGSRQGVVMSVFSPGCFVSEKKMVRVRWDDGTRQTFDLKDIMVPLLKLLDKIAEDVVVKLRNVERKDEEQGALDLEEVDKKKKLIKVMLRALRQKPTQRYMIYKVFVEQLVSRQAAVKILVSSGMSLSLDQLIAETWNYMQRFASYLVENGLSKVRYEPGTVLFAAQDNELREFFDFADPANNRGEIRRLALNVSPISREGDVFSFNHKSILEFLVAKQVHDGIMSAVRNTRMSLSSLGKILDCLEPVLQDNAEQMDAAHLERKLKALAGQDKLKELNKSSEQRRVAKLLMGLVRDVAASSIARVDLEEEEAVRDFVIDCLLSDVEFCSAFGIMAALCRLTRLHGGALSGLAYDNILHTCTSNNVKRDGNNLFYVAVEQNNLFLLKTAIDILQGEQTIGLSWTEVGAGKPKTGYEITNAALSTALDGKKQKKQEPDFTQAELDQCQMDGKLSCNSYIKVHDTYFKPRNVLLEQAWIHAAKEGDSDLLQVLVDAGADVDLLITGGMTALMYAGQQGHSTECVRVLLEGGADAAQRKMDGYTALMLACENKHETIAAELMEATKRAGALDLQAVDEEQSALHVAIEMGLAGTVAKLVSFGANVGLQMKHGRTALWLACWNEDYPVAAELMEATKLAGALDQQDDGWYGKRSALHLVVQAVGNRNQALSARRGYGDDITDPSALHAAHAEGKAGTVAKLLSLGANSSLTDQYGKTPLDYAKKEKEKVMLRKHGGKHSLLYAAVEGMSEVVAELIEEGADAALTYGDGSTALWLACYNKHESAAAELMEATKLAGALDQQDDRLKRSALHLASEAGLAGTVAKLLSLGADAALRDAGWQAPLDLAGNDEVKTAFAENTVITGDNKNTLLLACARVGLVPLLLAVLQAGANAAHTEEDGKTALMLACENKHQAVAAELMEATKLKGALNLQVQFPKSVAVDDVDTNEGQRERCSEGEIDFDDTDSQIMEKWECLFLEYMDDDSGELEIEGLRQLVAAQLGMQLSDEEAANLFRVMDLDGSGSVDFREFGTVILHNKHLAKDTGSVDFKEFATFILLQKQQKKDGNRYSERSALHFASANGLTGTVANLLSLGADAALADEDGNTPLDIARNDEVKAAFEEHAAKGGKVEQPIE